MGRLLPRIAVFQFTAGIPRKVLIGYNDSMLFTHLSLQSSVLNFGKPNKPPFCQAWLSNVGSPLPDLHRFRCPGWFPSRCLYSTTTISKNQMQYILHALVIYGGGAYLKPQYIVLLVRIREGDIPIH